MNLMKIKKEDLIFTDKCMEECINTELHLRDNSWMNYQLVTSFNTKNQGKLEVVFEYFGAMVSHMEVKRNVNEKTEKIIYEYSSDIFEEHIVKFIEKHLSSWKEYDAFNGEKLVLDFYNDVIEEGCVWKISSV